VMDRLVGFELSPVLWKKVKPSLSAGRVQSVAVRLLVEREREIINFISDSNYRVLADFNVSNAKTQLKAELNTRFKEITEAEKFLNKCKEAAFKVSDITKKPIKRTPAPPFTTSTLQQEASRKFGFSVSQTMTIAQKLYESGRITYMRTDSVNLADAAVQSISEQIVKDFGEKYLMVRRYKTKSKGAQEAHEAIRPTYINKDTVPGNANEKRLYELIWKRTVASLMSDAELEKTSIQIDISNASQKFVAQGEMIKFDGFLKVYIESTDDEEEGEKEGILPNLSAGQILNYAQINATQRFTQHPPRYTEASLVRKLEELGIGRPSTYAPTISTIQNRQYVIKEDRPGVNRNYSKITLIKGNISKTELVEVAGSEKSKLFPTDIGMVVNDYLMEQFPKILDYNFTADVEKDFDDIALGDLEWQQMINSFYYPFHDTIETALEISGRQSGERILGNDPKSGKPVIVKIGRYGPMAQIGENSDEEKPQYAALRRDQHIESITLDEALELFKLPREIGEFEGKKVVAAIGRFGPYIRHDNKFYSLKKGVDDPFSVEINRAIELIQEKREAEKNKTIQVFNDENGEIQILNGRFGPYITCNKNNYRIPKGVDASKITFEECKEIIEKTPVKKAKRSK